MGRKQYTIFDYDGVHCVICGKKTKRKNWTVCSPECRSKRDLMILEWHSDSDTARYLLFLRDDFKCVYCGRSSIEDGVKLRIDHVMPHSKIANNNLYNLVTCCDPCNLLKGDKELSLDVYHRIVRRNMIKNKERISDFSREFVEKTLKEYFRISKYEMCDPCVEDYSWHHIVSDITKYAVTAQDIYNKSMNKKHVN